MGFDLGFLLSGSHGRDGGKHIGRRECLEGSVGRHISSSRLAFLHQKGVMRLAGEREREQAADECRAIARRGRQVRASFGLGGGELLLWRFARRFRHSLDYAGRGETRDVF